MPGDRAVRRSHPFDLRPIRLIAAPRFQEFVSRMPLLRRIAHREGAEIFSLLQGFVASQVLSALVETRLLRRLLGGAARVEDLAAFAGLPADRVEILLRAAAALRLVRRRRDGRFALARRGAAILGVPGLEAMIAHHRAFYADMADPVALLQGDGSTALSRFWPYVLSEEGAADPAVADRYSDLMAKSQVLVAEDTIRLVDFARLSRLMDVGGGSGAFLTAVLRRHPGLSAMLVDLPEVAPFANAHFEREGLSRRVTVCPQSFRDAALPTGSDAISLVRVLYDHEDETVEKLLAASYSALPPGGRLIISEPMSGGTKPDPAADVYFAFYTMAMGTGRVRSSARIAEMCCAAGFTGIRAPRPLRPYVTSVVTAVRPG